MENNEIKVPKLSVEDRIWKKDSEKCTTMQNSNSRLFYWTIVVLNVFILVIASLLIGNKEKVEKFGDVFENMGWQNIILLVFMFFAIMILKTLPDYLKLFSKTKRKKFFTCYISNSISEFYDGVTIYNKGKILSTNYLISKKTKTTHAVDMAYSKSFINKISFMMYSLIFLFLGVFLWVKFIPILMYLLALIGFIFNLTIILFTIYFGKYKDEAMGVIASICKFLVKIKLIRDYEKLFYNIVDTLIVYNKTFKQSKLIIWTEIYANVLIYFIKGLAIYLLCYSMNLIESNMFFRIIFISVILQVILNMWPLPKGTLIFEMVFLTLLKNYFFAGYIYWAIVFYRVFDYVLCVIQYLIVQLILKIKGEKLQKNSTMQS